VKLLFELASDERLFLLECIEEKPRRLSDISKELRITTPEVYRQLNRLVARRIVNKTPDGLYGITSYGRLILHSLNVFKFLTKHREFILSHDLLVIPLEFIRRLGELNECEMVKGVYRIITVQEKYMEETESRLWTMSRQIFHRVFPVLEKLSGKSVDIRIILPKSIVETQLFKKLESRYSRFIRFLDEVDLVVGVLDRVGGICFPSLDGKIDLTYMIGCTDPASYRWLTDLYSHYWEKAEPRH